METDRYWSCRKEWHILHMTLARTQGLRAAIAISKLAGSRAATLNGVEFLRHEGPIDDQ